MRLALIILASCAPMPYVAPAPRSHDQQLAADVMVNSSCGLTWDIGPSATYDRIATGVLINDRTVLTALHAVTCPAIPHVWVTFGDGSSSQVAVTAEDGDRDMAVLSSRVGNFEAGIAPPVLGPVPRVGAEVCALGRCGRVTGINEEAIYGAKGDILHSVAMMPGNSGSGLYDAEGRLVGINTMSITCEHGGDWTNCGGQASPVWKQ